MLGRSQIARCFLTMPNRNTDADTAMKKLGHHVRLGWVKKHPVADKSLESVRDVIREKWELEQQTKRTAAKPTPTPSKGKTHKPPEPER
jgi:hypothetical protein